MLQCRLMWDDAANSREVELTIDYRLVEGEAQIGEITPVRVMLYDASSRVLKRVLSVTTPTGRQVLARAYKAAQGGQSAIAADVLSRHLADQASSMMA